MDGKKRWKKTAGLQCSEKRRTPVYKPGERSRLQIGRWIESANSLRPVSVSPQSFYPLFVVHDGILKVRPGVFPFLMLEAHQVSYLFRPQVEGEFRVRASGKDVAAHTLRLDVIRVPAGRKMVPGDEMTGLED